MDELWVELIRELGGVVEAAGRMLKRKPPLSEQDLIDLQRTLQHAARTVRIARANTFVEGSKDRV